MIIFLDYYLCKLFQLERYLITNGDCMIRFPSLGWPVMILTLFSGLLFSDVYSAFNPFGIKFMSKNRFDCATKNTFLVLNFSSCFQPTDLKMTGCLQMALWEKYI